MNIKILDSWLREYLKTDASPEKIGECLSLTSVGVEKIEPYGEKDVTYDIEVTTNRPDLMSVVNLAREAATVLQQFGITAEFKPLVTSEPQQNGNLIPVIIEEESVATLQGENKEQILTIKNNSDLINRICAVIMDIELKQSPKLIQNRLESADIRSLNNIIDVTNYVMREVGHPTHVFDYDRLTSRQLEIRLSRPKEKIKTLDGKEYQLPGDDIVADDGLGHIIDLIGIMGLENSVVTEKTKRILFFIDSNEPVHIRRTSMATGIRTEAAVLNEKGIDPELAMTALLRGIQLYTEFANGKIVSEIIDIYPNKVETKEITVNENKINTVIGVQILPEESMRILQDLGFDVKQKDKTLLVTPSTSRAEDVQIEEDVIEEIARIHGYHTLPSVLPPLMGNQTYNRETDPHYWENRTKHALKYWGFDEVYTYSLVSEDLLEDAPETAVKLKNPLSNDMVYLRQTLVPSLLGVIHENRAREEIKIFEISNVYKKRKRDLPEEIQMLAGVVKKSKADFLEVKGIITALFEDLGIKNYSFEKTTRGGDGADVYISFEQTGNESSDVLIKKPKTGSSLSEVEGLPLKKGLPRNSANSRAFLGEIEILDENTIDFELNFELIRNAATNAKVYSPIAKFPPIIEDMRFEIPESKTYEEIVTMIKQQSDLIKDVMLLDLYHNKKTFRITYQDPEKNLTNEDVTPIREKITHALEKKCGAKLV